ncbi:MAG: hypothetical protein SGILL_004488 [Bacillariaceae sp.]
MSFQALASPAPAVEGAEATPATASGTVTVEPARDSEAVHVDPPRDSGPAVPFDKKFAPKITVKEASALSVEALRGSGTDFESEAGVIKGGVEKTLLRKTFPRFFDYRDFLSYGEVRRFLFVKGNCIFVYGQEADTRPLYAIQMESVISMVEDPSKPDPYSYTVNPQVNNNKTGSHLVTILLKHKKTRAIAYQINFDVDRDPSVAKRFMDVLQVNAKHYGGEVITASVVFAQDTAKQLPQKAKR